MTEPDQAAGEIHQPIAIDRDGDDAILITWSDRTKTRWTAAQLRSICPCATCREKKRGDAEDKSVEPTMLPVLSAAEARPMRIETMRPIGVYAYNIAFSDGHSSGIYPFSLLREHDDSSSTSA